MKHSTVLGVALAIVSASTLAALAGVVDTRPACNRAFEWVHAHRQDLPRTLDQIATFPTGYRIQIFTALSPDEKAALWREQMERALLRDDLNEAQRVFIREHIRFITPEFYAEHQRLPDVEALARQLFVVPEHQEIMITLGAVVPHRWRYAPGLWVSLEEALLTGPAAPPDCGNCSCSLDEGCWNHCYIMWGLSCEWPPEFGMYCTVHQDGCGFWGGCQCNGCCCTSQPGGTCINENQ